MTNQIAYQTFGKGRAWTLGFTGSFDTNAFEMQGFVMMDGNDALSCQSDPFQPIG